jgi:predicted Zn-dependent protease
LFFIPSFFRIFKKQFHYQQISPYLVAISKTKTDVVEGVAGIIVEMLDKKYGLIKFSRGSESEMALFSVNALFRHGFKADGNPSTFPPVHMDA